MGTFCGFVANLGPKKAGHTLVIHKTHVNFGARTAFSSNVLGWA